MIVVLVVVAVGALSGLLAGAATRRWPNHDPAAPSIGPGSPVLEASTGRRARLRALWRSRLDPEVATGLALTLAVATFVALLAVAGILLLMVRTVTGVARFDRASAGWGDTHATVGSTDVLRGLCLLGGTAGVIFVAVVAGFVEYRRLPDRAVPVLLAATVLGQFALTNGIKEIVERARPDISQLTGFAGSSFPSGHASAAAATFAVVALLAGRRRSRSARAVIAGVAVAVAVIVAGTRVFLGVHWLTDVLAGLAVGWAWFALWSIAFGGRLLEFGAPADLAERVSSRG